MSKAILIVEDDKTTSAIIRTFLKNLGYEDIDSACSGEESIEKLKKRKSDIVLMDITLEGELDGIDSAKYINDNFKIPVVYITSSTDEDTIDKAKRSNPYGYIIKPIEKSELKAAIEMSLIRYSMEQQLIEGEQKFATILNSIGDAVVVLDNSGLITYMNPVAERITECLSAQACGSKLGDIVEIEYIPPEQISPDTEPHLLAYIFLTTRTGKKIPVDFRAAPIVNIDQDVVGSVIIFRDDTGQWNANLKIRDSFIQLRKTMGGIITAMSHTIEARDPYTAGHQRRVSDLAREIAHFLGLNKNDTEGIRMAGIIHDIGKISIPAEILSKPGRLSDMEFNLIKIHPQTGYDILKPIDFPWPIADMVHQHHERLNGSGYPNGLTSDQILPESKILAVADVVEAMASHRPYRASLGIELALDEIIKNAGILYDPEISEACVKIFKEKQYQMKFDER